MACSEFDNQSIFSAQHRGGGEECCVMSVDVLFNQMPSSALTYDLDAWLY